VARIDLQRPSLSERYSPQPSLFRAKITGVTTVFAVVIAILTKANLEVGLAQHTKAVALALLL
jgi:hypothetical protein